MILDIESETALAFISVHPTESVRLLLFSFEIKEST